MLCERLDDPAFQPQHGCGNCFPARLFSTSIHGTENVELLSAHRSVRFKGKPLKHQGNVISRAPTSQLDEVIAECEILLALHRHMRVPFRIPVSLLRSPAGPIADRITAVRKRYPANVTHGLLLVLEEDVFALCR